MPTLKDVSKLAGVSASAVSRVLNGDETLSVSDETRRAILSAAERLQYQPVKKRGKTDSKKKVKIALLLLYDNKEEMMDPYYLTIRTHIQAAAAEYKIDLRGAFCPPTTRLAQNFAPFAGIIVLGSTMAWTHDLRDALYQSGKPVVIVDFEPPFPGADYVVADFYNLVKKALSRFLDLGYETIGYLGSTEYAVGTHEEIVEKRLKYFRKILSERGLLNEKYVYINQNRAVSSKEGYDLMRRILGNADKLPRALFIENDTLAIGALRALKEHGVRVPEDVAVIACDDIPAAEFLSPPLSTVRIHADCMGRLAVTTLLDRLASPRKPGLRILVENELIARQSCGSKTK